MGEKRRRQERGRRSDRPIDPEAQQAVRTVLNSFKDDADFCLPVYLPAVTSENPFHSPASMNSMPLAMVWSKDDLESHYAIGVNGVMLENLLAARLSRTHRDFPDAHRILMEATQMMARKTVESILALGGGAIKQLKRLLEHQKGDGRRTEPQAQLEDLEPVVHAALNAVFQRSGTDPGLLRPVFRPDIKSETQAESTAALPVVYIWSKDDLRTHYSVSVNVRAVRKLLAAEMDERHPQFERAMHMLARAISGAANDTVQHVMTETGAGGQAIRRVFTRGPKDPPPFTA